jgi:hypothetical protein
MSLFFDLFLGVGLARDEVVKDSTPAFFHFQWWRGWAAIAGVGFRLLAIKRILECVDFVPLVPRLAVVVLPGFAKRGLLGLGQVPGESLFFRIGYVTDASREIVNNRRVFFRRAPPKISSFSLTAAS